METNAQKRKSQKIFGKLLKDKTNKVCIDCGDFNPQWASVTNAVLFCLKCAGTHRAMGVHISFVRSVNLDTWSDAQLASMKSGGNRKAKEFWKDQGFPASVPTKQKYDNEAMVEYRKQILRCSRGEDWEKIGRIGFKVRQRKTKQKTMQSMSGGFGSAPPEPQNDPWADWFSTVGDLTKSVTKTVGDGVASGAATLSNKVQTIDTEDLSKKVQDGWTNFGGWMSNMAEKTLSDFRPEEDEEEDFSSVLRKNLGTSKQKMASLSSKEVIKKKKMPSLSSEEYHRKNRKQMPSLSSEECHGKKMPSLSSDSMKRKKMSSLSSDSLRGNSTKQKKERKPKATATVVEEDDDDLDNFGFDDDDDFDFEESEESSPKGQKTIKHTNKISVVEEDLDDDFDKWGWSEDEAETEI